MIFQEPTTSLNPVQTAGAQVVEAIRAPRAMASRAEARAPALALFEQVGIPDPRARLRRLSAPALGRPQAARDDRDRARRAAPKLLIADEPTTALDVTVQAQILDLLRRLARETGTAVLLITHDLGVVNEIADRVAVMYAGRIVEEGSRARRCSARPRHPYTQGLLRAMPGRVQPGERLAEIPGAVPAPDAWPPGCRFAPIAARW